MSVVQQQWYCLNQSWVCMTRSIWIASHNVTIQKKRLNSKSDGLLSPNKDKNHPAERLVNQAANIVNWGFRKIMRIVYYMILFWEKAKKMIFVFSWWRIRCFAFRPKRRNMRFALYHSTTLTCSRGLQPRVARACVRGCIASALQMLFNKLGFRTIFVWGGTHICCNFFAAKNRTNKIVLFSVK